jgi:hypothetical protein
MVLFADDTSIIVTGTNKLDFVRFEVSTAVTVGLVSYKSVPIQELTTSLCNLLALVHPEDGGDTIL